MNDAAPSPAPVAPPTEQPTPEPAPAPARSKGGAGSRDAAVTMADLAELERAAGERFARIEARLSSPDSEPADDDDDAGDDDGDDTSPVAAEPRRVSPGWALGIIAAAALVVAVLLKRKVAP